ncbi:hypothetical protein FQZ97_542590 [compost metagenome]
MLLRISKQHYRKSGAFSWMLTSVGGDFILKVLNQGTTQHTTLRTDAANPIAGRCNRL